MIADVLRERIVNGDLEDGSLLPKQDDLLEEFQVSRPSIREAMRILETEGLITVRRGNMGGAFVHAPKAEPAAYMLGLVLQNRNVTLADLGEALRILEPACAALCANHPRRGREVVPGLRRLMEQAEAALDDGVEFTRLSRQFHDQLVASCGNKTIIALVGTLETLWSSQEVEWAEQVEAEGRYPETRLRRAVLQAHQRMLATIEAGEADAAARVARRHLAESQQYVLVGDGDHRISAARRPPPRR